MPPNAFAHVGHHERRRPRSHVGLTGVTVEDLRRRRRLHHGRARPPASPATEHRGHHALGQQQNHEDQDERDGGAAQHRLLAAGEGVERGRDERRADRRAQPVPRAPEHAHQHHVERHRDRERLAHRDVAHVHGVDAAGHPGDPGREREGRELVAKGGNALDLGDVLVVVDGEQPEAQARAADGVGHAHRGHGQGQAQQIDRARRRGQQARQRHGAQEHPGTAVDARVEHDRAQHERDGQRQQAEELAAQALHPEDHGADPRPQRRRDQAGGEQRPEERDAERAW